MFGIIKVEFEHVKKCIREFKEINSVIIFGSRAMGIIREGADVDLAVIGDNITQETISKLNKELNKKQLASNFFDVIDYNVSNEKLKEHIDLVGKVLYEKNEI